MFNRILLPLDGSALAECTIPHALALAKLTGAKIILLHVIEENSGEAGVDPLEWHFRKASVQTYCDGVCEKLRAMDVSIESVLLAGEPTVRIVEQVQNLNVDLVLISSHGRSGQMDSTLGAVAHNLILNVGTSLLLVHCDTVSEKTPTFAPAQYHRLLISLDGSRRAECILPIAERLAEEYRADLVLAHVVRRPNILRWPGLTEEDRCLADQLIAHTQSVAESYLQEIQSRQDRQATLVISQADNVATELSAIAKQHQVDLVLVSAHGASANPLRTFGDTVHGILAYCTQSVLVYQDQPVNRAGRPETAPLRGRQGEKEHISPMAA